MEKNSIDTRWDSFWTELGQHWLRYAALMVTGALTGFAAWSLTSQWQYVIAIILLAEGSALFWAARIEDYGNRLQMVASIGGTALAWIAITVTDLASATIIARLSNLEIFSQFAEVPAWAQRSVVYVVPVLAVCHGVLATVHYYFSESAALRRDASKSSRDAQRRINEAKARAKIAIATAEAMEYERLADEKAPAIGAQRGAERWEGDTAVIYPPAPKTDGKKPVVVLKNVDTVKPDFTLPPRGKSS